MSFGAPAAIFRRLWVGWEQSGSQTLSEQTADIWPSTQCSRSLPWWHCCPVVCQPRLDRPVTLMVGQGEGWQRGVGREGACCYIVQCGFWWQKWAGICGELCRYGNNHGKERCRDEMRERERDTVCRDGQIFFVERHTGSQDYVSASLFISPPLMLTFDVIKWSECELLWWGAQSANCSLLMISIILCSFYSFCLFLFLHLMKWCSCSLWRDHQHTKEEDEFKKSLLHFPHFAPFPPISLLSLKLSPTCLHAHVCTHTYIHTEVQ